MAQTLVFIDNEEWDQKYFSFGKNDLIRNCGSPWQHVEEEISMGLTTVTLLASDINTMAYEDVLGYFCWAGSTFWQI